MSDKPVRVQQKRTKGWRMPENTRSVARPGKWGNPFKIGEDAFRFSLNVPYKVPKTVEQVVEDYRYYVFMNLVVDPTWMSGLKGKNLACWCALDAPCHADVLLELQRPRNLIFFRVLHMASPQNIWWGKMTDRSQHTDFQVSVEAYWRTGQTMIPIGTILSRSQCLLASTLQEDFVSMAKEMIALADKKISYIAKG